MPSEIFLVDTYFGSEENRKDYFSKHPEGDGMDPCLGGLGSFKQNSQANPREYFTN